MSTVQLRPADPSDAPRILALIQALALYEKEPDAVEVDAETLRAQLGADRPPFECVLAMDGGDAVGFALYFQTYSTWRGRPGMWLEDLFVVPESRGRGIGKELLSHLAAEAVRREYGRLEWSVLDWNESAIRFYESLGAAPMDEWTTHRVDRDSLS
ncbi:MAG: GNAT family N-acetyltransferase, partial [Deltaproteobacteria bacterium]|nr:GNAT family N-acetyltransferase [Deltaproteobacteria bacterium]